jgi:predicted metal-dependent phosphoesterase TrpH
MSAVATDLHGHTLFSDGRTTPEEYVRVRAARELEVVAVADHDVFTAVPRAAAAAARHGLTLVPAMEVTAFWGFGTAEAEQIHVLAYLPPARLAELPRTALGRRAARIKAGWRDFIGAWVDDLPEPARRALDPDGALLRLPEDDFPMLQSFIELVIARAGVFFERFRREHVRFWEQDRELFGWTPEEAIETIRGDGGLDVVAHPVRTRDPARMERLLGQASGLEVYTSRHRPETAAHFRAFAEAQGKHWTASTDDHQHVPWNKPPEGTPRRTIERILAGA